MQRERLDTCTWDTPHQLGTAIFEWIDAWFNPRRRHTNISDLAPTVHETPHARAAAAARSALPPCPEERSGSVAEHIVGPRTPRVRNGSLTRVPSDRAAHRTAAEPS